MRFDPEAGQIDLEVAVRMESGTRWSKAKFSRGDRAELDVSGVTATGDRAGGGDGYGVSFRTSRTGTRYWNVWHGWWSGLGPNCWHQSLLGWGWGALTRLW